MRSHSGCSSSCEDGAPCGRRAVHGTGGARRGAARGVRRAARLGAARLGFRDRWAVLAAARIYTAIGRKVLDRGQLAWNKRVVVSGPEKLWHIIAAWWEALRNNPHEPDQMPIYSRELIRPLKGW